MDADPFQGAFLGSEADEAGQLSSQENEDPVPDFSFADPLMDLPQGEEPEQGAFAQQDASDAIAAADFGFGGSDADGFGGRDGFGSGFGSDSDGGEHHSTTTVAAAGAATAAMAAITMPTVPEDRAATLKQGSSDLSMEGFGMDGGFGDGGFGDDMGGFGDDMGGFGDDVDGFGDATGGFGSGFGDEGIDADGFDAPAPTPEFAPAPALAEVAAAAEAEAEAEALALAWAEAAAPVAPGEWTIDAVTVSTFSQMFADACAAIGPGTHRLGKAEAGAVLSMSGLPTDVLLSIWSLADVDGDDRLDLRGYLLCCWLVQRSVQKQLPPPVSLPPELLASATTAVASPTEPPPAEPPRLPAAPVEGGFGFDSGGFGDADFADGFSSAPAPAPAPAPVVAPAPAAAAAFGGDFSGAAFGADFDDAGIGGNFAGAAVSMGFAHAAAAAPTPAASVGFEAGASGFGEASGFGDAGGFGDFGGDLIATAPDASAAAPEGSVSQVHTPQMYTGPYALQMEQLVDMGLSDLEANARELERNSGDITATVTSLLGNAEGSR